MQKEYKYKAFISYSHKDKAFAKWLHKRIENYKIPKSLREKYPHLPKDLKRSVFRDEEELPTSSVLGDNLKYALDHSQKLIVICSPSAVASKWVNEEIRYFKEVHGEFSVLTIIKEGEPNASSSSVYDDALEAFPESLRYVLGEDGKLTDQATEPLAGDARKGNDKEMALMKLIAGVLEVDFADLWEREKKEAWKRKAIFTFVLALFMALAFYASTQFVGEKIDKELKKINTNIITIEYSIRHDKHTEKELISLNKKLEKLKKDKINSERTNSWFKKFSTPLLDEISRIKYEQGVDVAVKVLASKTAKANREQRHIDSSRELVALANMYVEQYKFNEANKSYSEAIDEFFDYNNVLEYSWFLYKQTYYTNSIKLLKKLEKNKLIFLEKTGLYTLLGLSYYEQNNLLYSENYLKKAIELFQITFDNKNNKIIQLYFADILHNLGRTHIRMNKYEDARKEFDMVFEIRNKFANDDYFILAKTLNNMSGLYPLDINKTLNIELKALAVINKIQFNNVKQDSLKARIYSKLTNTYIKMKKDEEFNQSSKKAFNLYLKLFYSNPIKYQKPLYDISLNIGIYKYSLNRFDKGENFYKKVIAVFQNKKEIDIKYLLVFQENLAALYFKSKKYKDAEFWYLNSLKSRKKLDRDNLKDWTIDIKDILYNLGNLYIENNRIDEAIVMFEEEILYLDKLVKNYGEDSKELLNELKYLAKLYYKKNEFEKLEEKAENIVSIYQKIIISKNSGEELSWINSLDTLLSIYIENKELEKAEKIYFKSLDIYSHLYSKHTYEYDTNMVNLLGLGYIYDLDKNDKLPKIIDLVEKYPNDFELIKELMKLKGYVILDINESDLIDYSLLENHYNMRLKDINKVREYYKKSLTLDSNNSSAFINLYELQIITNQEINQTFEEAYVKAYQDKKEEFIVYEMLKIIKDITQNRKTDIETWKRKYKDVHLGWSFKELKAWARTLKDEKTKKSVNEALEVFEKHNKN